MRKPIEQSSSELTVALKMLTAKERDSLARHMLRWSREREDGGRMENVAIAMDSLCFSIDGSTEL